MDKIAKELLKVAKELCADYGDMSYFVNMSDFFEKTDGTRFNGKEFNLLNKVIEERLDSQMTNIDKLLKKDVSNYVNKTKGIKDWMKEHSVKIKK